MGLGLGSIQSFDSVQRIAFKLVLNGTDSIRLPEMPLIRTETRQHLSAPSVCLNTHGFYDVEREVCTTVHRLAKVCVTVIYDEEGKFWFVDEPPADLDHTFSSKAEPS